MSTARSILTPRLRGPQGPAGQVAFGKVRGQTIVGDNVVRSICSYTFPAGSLGLGDQIEHAFAMLRTGGTGGFTLAVRVAGLADATAVNIDSDQVRTLIGIGFDAEGLANATIHANLVPLRTNVRANRTVPAIDLATTDVLVEVLITVPLGTSVLIPASGWRHLR